MYSATDIKKLRQKLMLDQQEFAKVMRVDVGTVSRWERKKQRPKARHQRSMARLASKVKK